MASLPYMQLYVADYLADTAHLTTEEHGAYLLLIFNYWQRGKPLPNNDKRLAMIARLSNERWTDVKETLNEFFNVTPTCWQHHRIDKDLAEVSFKSNSASLAGKASAEAKRLKKQQKTTDVTTDVQRNVNHTEQNRTEQIITDKNIKTTTALPHDAETIDTKKQPSGDDTQIQGMKWVEFFVNKVGFQIHEAQTAKTVPMFVSWVETGVTIADVDLAMIAAKKALNGVMPSNPMYYRRFVDQVILEKQKIQSDPTKSSTGLELNNNRGEYGTKNPNAKAGNSAGRKLSLVDEAQLAIERVEAREIREREDQAKVIN